jgi:hypothetical protein
VLPEAFSKENPVARQQISVRGSISGTAHPRSLEGKLYENKELVKMVPLVLSATCISLNGQDA